MEDFRACSGERQAFNGARSMNEIKETVLRPRLSAPGLWWHGFSAMVDLFREKIF